MVSYGGNRPTVKDDEVLTAQDFNDATRFWVTDELPDAGKDGDVVFVVGDEPSGGGINVESQRKHQLLQGDDAKGWVPGMAMSVVDQLPADDAEGYAIGDVVFVTGPGDGGSSLVGGGKVLQVVMEWDGTQHESTLSNTPVDTGHSLSITPKNANSTIIITAQYAGDVTQIVGYTSGYGHIRILDEADEVVQGAERSRLGLQGDVDWVLMSGFLHVVGVDQISSTDTKTYRTQFWPTGGAGSMKIRNDANTGLLMAMEVSP